MDAKKLALFSLLLLGGCATRSSYRIEFQYLSPIQNGESRQVSGYVNGSGLTSSTILVEFPRTIKLINDEFIGKGKR